MRIASFVAAATLLLTTRAYGADAASLVGSARQRVEATDARGTGHLVRVDANGTRTNNSFSLKAHWFPGALQVLLEVVPARSATESVRPAAGQKPEADLQQDGREGARKDARVAILFEMRPGGQSTIRVFHPGEATPLLLPSSRWGESVFGTDFSYEDFLQQELYWKSQALLKTAQLGAHDCDVLKSTPGPSNRSHYSEVDTWLDQTTGYPIYTEKKSENAATVKEFTSLGLTQSGGVWTARQVQVKVHDRPGSTMLIFDRGSTKAHLTAKDFSPEQISRFEDHP